MNNTITAYHLDLCERIRAQCKRRPWFGPRADRTSDPHAPEMYEADGTWHPADWSFFGYREYIDEQGQLRTRKITHDPRSGFEFPPATEEQVRATEEALGHTLPPMLKALYTTVANGGFGPGCGLTGIQGGYFFGGDDCYDTLDAYRDDDPSLIYFDLAAYERERDYPRKMIWNQVTHHPKNFWPICYGGCGEDYCIDANSGRIYLIGGGGSKEDELRFNWGKDDLPCYVICKAPSFEEWLEKWLQYED